MGVNADINIISLLDCATVTVGRVLGRVGGGMSLHMCPVQHEALRKLLALPGFPPSQ